MTKTEAIALLRKIKPISCRGNGKSTTAILLTIAIEMAIEALEQTRWIPYGERLPEEETDVLVTRMFLGCKDGRRWGNTHIPPNTYVEVAQYLGEEWTALSDEYKVARSRHTDPVAWMRLPAPYREGEAYDQQTEV